jgi:hypothetical protein
MRHARHSTMFGSALLAVAGFWLTAPGASAISSSAHETAMSAVMQPAASLRAVGDPPSPYEQGYKDGYAAGDARAWNTCNWDGYPQTSQESAYSQGYSSGYSAGWDAGNTKHCQTPAL